jgi:hypothetical protein
VAQRWKSNSSKQKGKAVQGVASSAKPPVSKHRVLSEHFARVKAKLLEYARHFDIVHHGDTKGFGREALVSEFLVTHLPDQFEYLTGEILDRSDQRSGQIDIIIQSKRSPKIPLYGSIHLAFADAVLAAIEVKSTLTTQHLDMALNHFRKIKSLKREYPIVGSSSQLDLETIPCVIFAFSGLAKDTVIRSVNEFARANNLPLSQFAPDLVVVLDRDYYVCRNDGWIFPVIPIPGAFFRDWVGLGHENLVGLYTYLYNITQSHLGSYRPFRIDPYFDKSILRAQTRDETALDEQKKAT